MKKIYSLFGIVFLLNGCSAEEEVVSLEMINTGAADVVPLSVVFEDENTPSAVEMLIQCSEVEGCDVEFTVGFPMSDLVFGDFIYFEIERVEDGSNRVINVYYEQDDYASWTNLPQGDHRFKMIIDNYRLGLFESPVTVNINARWEPVGVLGCPRLGFMTRCCAHECELDEAGCINDETSWTCVDNGVCRERVEASLCGINLHCDAGECVAD